MSKRKSVQDICVGEHLKKTKPNTHPNSGKIEPAKTNHLLMNKPRNSVDQNYSKSTSFNNRRGLLNKTNTPDLHAMNQQIQGTAFSVLPSGFLVKKNYSTQVLDEQEPIEELPTAYNVFSQSDDSTQDSEREDENIENEQHVTSSEREDENVENEQHVTSSEREDENVENEQHDNNNNTKNLLNFEQLTHDIDKCC
ncbi:hypothetical protein RF55_16793, partial [Lasius niger]